MPGAPPDTAVNLWTLALIDPLPPKGVGTVVIPVRRGAEPVDYFGGLTGERLVVRDDHVAFRLDARSIGKLGIRPEDIDPDRSAKVAAFLPALDSDRLLLVLQRSGDVPRSQSECLDVAKAAPEGPKGVLQAYNHGPGDDRRKRYPKFGEIEIQLVAARPEGKGLSARAISDLLAFEGPRDDVMAFGAAILDIRELQTFA